MQKRIWVTTALAIAVMGATPALAGDGPDDENDYEGRVEKDPSTYFGFDLDGSKAKGFTALATLACTTTDSQEFPTETKGSLTVNDDRFKGKLDVKVPNRRGALVDGNYKINGKLGPNGTANGTVDIEVFVGPNRCYTGRVDWKAKKSADIEFP